MRSLFTLILSLCCLVSYTLAANIPRLDREPALGKVFYTIFPKNGTDTSKTRDFIRGIFGTEDLLAWSDLEENLVSWTVEASPEEVAQLRDLDSVENVVEFNLTSLTADRSVSGSNTLPSHSAELTGGLSEREEPKVPDHGWFVFPRDGSNKDETSKTENFLKQLITSSNVERPFIYHDKLEFWVVVNSKSFQLPSSLQIYSSPQ